MAAENSEMSKLNDDECKRILAVIERDFKLRQQENKRIGELKTVIRQEQDRLECLSGSKELNAEHCIRCFKPFKMFFNPKESCSVCHSFVCHQCSINDKATKSWACKICVQLTELGCLTSEWFYLESSKKYKRCGSAKVVRELHRRGNGAETDEFDEDFGYGTLPASVSIDSKDSGSLMSYVVHDKNLKSELSEYSKRLTLLIDDLQADIAERHTDYDQLSLRSKRRERLQEHRQHIAAEISRARTALSNPIRRSGAKPTGNYEIDLQNILIQQTELVLRTDFRQVREKLLTLDSSADFDQILAQAIHDKCVNKQITFALSDMADSASLPTQTRQCVESSPVSTDSPKPLRPSPVHSPVPLTHRDFLPPVPAQPEEIPSEGPGRMDFGQADVIDEEDENDSPTSSVNDLTLHQQRSLDPTIESLRISTERVDDWKARFCLVESKIVPSDDDDDDDEQEIYSTWL